MYSVILGGWRKIVLKRCLKGGGVGTGTPGGGGFVLVSTNTATDDETNTVTDPTTGNSDKTSKKKVGGERRKRQTQHPHTVYLETQFEKDLLHSQEGRQNVDTVLTKESGDNRGIDVEKVNTWVRNHKHKKRSAPSLHQNSRPPPVQRFLCYKVNR
jgi:hypothetical protein